MIWRKQLVNNQRQALNQHQLTRPIDSGNILDEIKLHILSDLSHIDSIISIKQKIFLFGGFVGARPGRSSAHDRRGTSALSECVVRTRLPCLNTCTQHWPKGWLLIWHGKNKALKEREGLTASPLRVSADEEHKDATGCDQEEEKHSDVKMGEDRRTFIIEG